MQCTVLLLAVVVLLALGSSVSASVILIEDGNLGAGSWGPDAARYGQTFTVPTGDSLMIDFTFDIVTLNDPFPFVSQVYGWDGYGRTIGSALFTSDVATTPTPGSNSYTRFTFTPNIEVNSGQQYVAFVTNVLDGKSLGTGVNSGGMMHLNSDNVYADGRFVWSSPTENSWAELPYADAVFRAIFRPNVVPEPASLGVWSLVVCCGVRYICRRNRH